MKLTKRFGILIKIIELCLYDIVNFILIFVLQLLAWSAIFFSLFSQSSTNFSTYDSTIVKLNEFVIIKYIHRGGDIYIFIMIYIIIFFK